MDDSILEDIGLTRAEIKIFLTLLKLGSSTAGEIVEKSGLQNAVVHRAFHSLSEKGLISYIFEGKKKYYQSADPKIFIQFIDEKKSRLEELLPELIKQQNTAVHKPIATIYKGKRGVKELLNKMIDTNSKE